MGRVSTCQKNCNTIDLCRAQVNNGMSQTFIADTGNSMELCQVPWTSIEIPGAFVTHRGGHMEVHEIQGTFKFHRTWHQPHIPQYPDDFFRPVTNIPRTELLTAIFLLRFVKKTICDGMGPWNYIGFQGALVCYHLATMMNFECMPLHRNLN